MSMKSELPKIAVGCKSKPFVFMWINSIHPAFAELTNLFVSYSCVQELALFLQLECNEKYIYSHHMHVLWASPLVLTYAFAFTQKEKENKLIFIKYQPSAKHQAELFIHKVSFLEYSISNR